ncbi:Uncharacterized protein TCM_031494 [Theobroma cacao]|uniref:RING-type domain-containing protein n=1 Tax=Theobroma cacao TaxID=3641 RepID=A0A061FES6_THECC|nr:Uncharacterized protein TCM_031494 [Theobroma cacao]
MNTPPSPCDNEKLNLPPMVLSLLAQTLALGSPSTIPNNATFNLDDFRTSIFVCIIGLMLFYLFYQILDRFLNCLPNERYDRDIELQDIANHRSAANSHWSREVTVHNSLWLLETLNGFMTFLGKTLDECVICLEDLEDDEPCRVFPVCKHVFHFDCIDNWLRNHTTCPLAYIREVHFRSAEKSNSSSSGSDLPSNNPKLFATIGDDRRVSAEYRRQSHVKAADL